MSIKTALNKTGFWFKKNSPELLTFGGIVLSATSIGLAINGSLKLKDKLKPTNLKLIKLQKQKENLIADGLNADEVTKEIKKEKLNKILTIAKVYGPCALTFGLSTAAVCGSHKIMKGRNLALATAYTALDTGYKAYRERVKEKLGEKVEEELYKDIREDSDTNDGENQVKNPHKIDGDDFKYWFDSSNPNWNNSGRLNLDWLLMTQQFLNNKLRANGYLFLSDVYDALGIEACYITERQKQMSRVIGWLYDPDDTTRDSWVSFGISDKLGNLTPYAQDMKMYDDRDVLLCFNPDGDILTGNGGKKTFMKYAK